MISRKVFGLGHRIVNYLITALSKQNLKQCTDYSNRKVIEICQKDAKLFRLKI